MSPKVQRLWLAFALADIAQLPLPACASDGSESCATLRNMDIFSTVAVQVGTPPQTFDLVADTGSNTLIVQSCVCQDIGSCPASFGRCFHGTNKSSTFEMPASTESVNGSPAVWTLTFGSGDIEAIVASDAVRVGHEEVMMNESLLLMVSQALDFGDEPFQGILGLDIPHPPPRGQQELQGWFEEPPGFLEKSGVRHFSVCFNLNADGVLGLNTAEQPAALGSTSGAHWSVGLQGLEVGGDKVPSQSCGKKACSAIADSGTTLMTGPQDQIQALFGTICEKWERCRNLTTGLSAELVARASRRSSSASSGAVDRSLSRAPTDMLARLADAFESHVGQGSQLDASDSSVHTDAEVPLPLPRKPEGYEVLQVLLEDCHSWLSEDVDLDAEMPTISFLVEGADGRTDKIEVTPYSYLAEMESYVYVWTQQYLLGLIPIWWPARKGGWICSTLFGISSEVSHDEWILGTPLFYEYRVHFDLGSTPPSMAFRKEACGECKSGAYFESKNSMSLLGGSSSARGLRQIRHAPRMPWPRKRSSFRAT